MKHTPGPWYYEDDSFAPYIVDSTRLIRLADVHDTPYLSSGSCGRRASKANAHLLASAPELLEALRWIVDHGDTGKGGRPAYHAMRAHARAAIAKAEGK